MCAVVNFNRYKRSLFLPTRIYVVGGSVLICVVAFSEFIEKTGLVLVDDRSGCAAVRFPKRSPWALEEPEAVVNNGVQGSSSYITRKGIVRGEAIFSPHGEEIHLFTRYANNGQSIVYDRLRDETPVVAKTPDEAIMRISRMRPKWKSPWAYW